MSGKRRITMQDVATEAGVGIATVDRVLNARAPVAPDTAARVVSAADAIGYHGKAILRRRLAELAPACRMGFLLQKEGKWVYQRLAEALRGATSACRNVRAEPVFSFVGSLSANGLAEQITRISSVVDVLAVVSVDHPAVSAAIAECTGRGVPVYALLSPLSTPVVAGYVGIDGIAAGRTAGWAMARMARAEGEIGVLLGSHRYLGQEANERGFRAAFAKYAPDRSIRDTMVYLDDEAVAYSAAQELLDQSEGMVGLYHSGGGVGGVARAIEESGRADRITYICHARTPDSVAALRAGTADLVISASFDRIATTLVTCMAETVRTGRARPASTPERFELLTVESL
ncbi:MAG: LacI family DNA-binding transcriptional regulator [Pseudomonadota bacterium]